MGCVTRRGLGCTVGAVGLGAAGRDSAATICCSCAFCCAVAVLPRLTLGAHRIEIIRALRDLLLQIGNLTPHCVLRRPLSRGRNGRRSCGGGCRQLLLLRLAELVQRVEVLPQPSGFGTCRIEIIRAARDLLLQVGNLSPQRVLRGPLFRGRNGRRSCGSGCRQLLLLRLAELVQRVEVLPQPAGFGTCRIEIISALRDLLLQVGDLTPQCILRRLLFGDYGGGRTGRRLLRRCGCSGLLLLRLAKLVQRVDVLPQLGGFGASHIQITRALRDLLLQIGNLTPIR